jgi:hypothetical protein
LCTLGCQFCLDCPSVLSSIYSPCDSIKPCNNNGKWRVSLMLITPLVASNCYIGEKMTINVLLVRLCRIISSGSNIISRSLQSSGSKIALSHISKKYSLFIRPSRDGAVLCDWVWRAGGWAGVHTGFRTITLVLYIGSLTNLATWFPCGRDRPYLFWGN